jgi:hypothetical protein
MNDVSFVSEKPLGFWLSIAQGRFRNMQPGFEMPDFHRSPSDDPMTIISTILKHDTE